MIIYLGVVITIVLFFGWFAAIFFGLITGFLAFKTKSIYDDAKMRKNIIEKMAKKEKEGVFIGGRKFNLNKEVRHGDKLPGSLEDLKINLGDVDQLAPSKPMKVPEKFEMKNKKTGKKIVLKRKKIKSEKKVKKK